MSGIDEAFSAWEDQGGFQPDDANGEFRLSPQKDSEAETPAEQTSDDPNTPADPQPDPYEKRYNDLLPEFTRRSQRLSELEKDIIPGLQSRLTDLEEKLQLAVRGQEHAAETPSPSSEITPELWMEIQADPEKGAKYIDSIVNKRIETFAQQIESALGPVLEDWQIEQEVIQAAREFGDDFFQSFPAIHKVMTESEKELSFAEAYKLVKAFGIQSAPPPAAETSNEPAPRPQATPEPGPPKMAASEIAAQAARLAPETSVAAEVVEKAPALPSVDQAFERALSRLTE